MNRLRTWQRRIHIIAILCAIALIIITPFDVMRLPESQSDLLFGLALCVVTQNAYIVIVNWWRERRR